MAGQLRAKLARHVVDAHADGCGMEFRGLTGVAGKESMQDGNAGTGTNGGRGETVYPVEFVGARVRACLASRSVK
jgi:hypothetical protein